MDVTGLARLGQNQLWKYVVSIDFVLAFSFHSPFHFHSVQSHNAIVFAPSSAFFKSRELFLSDQEWDNCWHARMTCNAVHYRHKWGKTALTAQGKYALKELGNLGQNGSKFGTGKAHTVRWLVAPLKCSQMREAMLKGIAATWGQLWPSAPGGQSRWFDKRLGVKWKIYCAAQPGFVSCCNQEASCLEIGFRVVFQPWDNFFSFLIRTLCFSPRGFGCFKTLT